jgi:hypothetical protein
LGPQPKKFENPCFIGLTPDTDLSMQAFDQTDFDWSDREKTMKEAEVLFANALKANADIR